MAPGSSPAPLSAGSGAGPGGAEEPRGHGDGHIHPSPLGWSRKAQWEGEPSPGRGRMRPTGTVSTRNPAGMGCWAGGTGCRTAAFESFHLLTRAVTTERVIGTRFSGTAARVPPARLGSPGVCCCAGGGAGGERPRCPIIGLFALLCHRLLDTGIAYGDMSRGRVLPLRCRTGVPLLPSTQNCCGEMGCSGRRPDVSPSVPQHGGTSDEPG